MSSAIYTSPQKLEADVLDILRAIPPERFPVPVSTWAVSFGTDSTDDEAFFVLAILDIETIPHGTLGAMSRVVREAVDERGLVPGAWTYVSVRTVHDPG